MISKLSKDEAISNKIIFYSIEIVYSGAANLFYCRRLSRDEGTLLINFLLPFAMFYLNAYSCFR